MSCQRKKKSKTKPQIHWFGKNAQERKHSQDQIATEMCWNSLQHFNGAGEITTQGLENVKDEWKQEVWA